MSPSTSTPQLKSDCHKNFANQPALDLEATLKRLGGDRGLLGDLAQLFVEDSPGLLHNITSGVADRDGPKTHHAAHALRGLAANFGAEHLTATLFELEQLATQREFSPAMTLVEEARHESARLLGELQPYLPN